MLTKIYGLYDARDFELIRYVGKANDPEYRLMRHIRAAQHIPVINKCLSNWICSLLDEGLKPSMRVLQVVSTDNWENAERDWIAKYRELNLNLLNVSDGGNAPSDFSQKVIGRRPEIKAQRSTIMRKLWADPEHRRQRTKQSPEYYLTQMLRGILRSTRLKQTRIRLPAVISSRVAWAKPRKTGKFTFVNGRLVPEIKNYARAKTNT